MKIFSIGIIIFLFLISSCTKDIFESWFGIAPSTDNSEIIEEENKNIESLGIISELQSSINLIPNPTLDYIEIVGVNSDSFNFVKIHDDKGKQVLNNSHFMNNKLNVASLSPGTYFVTFSVKNFEVVKKFIKL
jgi:hypothetical protein